MEIQSTIRVFKEGRTFVAYALELDVASCGGSKARALSNLKEAVRLFLEEAEKMGTLGQILDRSSFDILHAYRYCSCCASSRPEPR